MFKIFYFLIICVTVSLVLHSDGLYEALLWIVLGIVTLGAVVVYHTDRLGAQLRADILRLLWESHPLPIGTDKLADKLIALRLARASSGELELYRKKRWSEIGRAMLGPDAELLMLELAFLMNRELVLGRIIGTLENEASVDVLWGIAPVTPERGPWGHR